MYSFCASLFKASVTDALETLSSLDISTAFTEPFELILLYTHSK